MSRPAPLVLIATLAATPSLAGADPEHGAWLGAHCAGCHAETGSPAMPPLKGMDPDVFTAAMEAFREGTRAHLAMTMFARSVSESDIADLAAWLAEEGDR